MSNHTQLYSTLGGSGRTVLAEFNITRSIRVNYGIQFMTSKRTKQKLEEIPVPADQKFDEIIVRKSIIVFFARFITLHVIHLIFLLVIYAFFVLVSGSALMEDLLLMLFIFICTSSVVVMLSVYIYARWKAHFYTVFPHAIVEKKGVFHKIEKSFACNRIESVSLRESFLGRMCNFGSVSLYDALLEKNIYLTNVDSPEKISDTLKKIYVTEKEIQGNPTAPVDNADEEHVIARH
jgi:membrane protein YdbS with pleckstrin-like domain